MVKVCVGPVRQRSFASTLPLALIGVTISYLWAMAVWKQRRQHTSAEESVAKDTVTLCVSDELHRGEHQMDVLGSPLLE
jgi:hypothetical protein